MSILSARDLSDFLGAWNVSRQILQDTGPNATFAGQGIWTDHGDHALYKEMGVLSIDGQGSLSAEQSYIWHSDLSVWFDETRFFHNVPVSGGDVGHFCAPDQYDGCYDFSTWPQWSVVWSVSGPRKSYRSETAYRRF